MRLREALNGCGAFFAAGRRDADPLETLRDLTTEWLRADSVKIIVPSGTHPLHSDEPKLLYGSILIGRRVVGRIEAYRSYPFEADDRAMLSALGQIIGAVLERSALQSQLDQYVNQAQANAETLDQLLSFSHLVVSGTANPQQMAIKLVSQVPSMVSGERASLLLLPLDSPDAPELVLSNGTVLREARARAVRDHGMAGLVLRARAPMIIDETDTDQRWLALKLNENDAPTRCAMAAPLIWGDQLLGAITVTTPQTHRFDTAQLNLLELVACHISLALHAANLDASLNRLQSDVDMLVSQAQQAIRAARNGDLSALDRAEQLLQQLATKH